MNTAVGVMPGPTPAQGFPETYKSMHSLSSPEGVTATDPRTPGTGSPLAPGGLANTLRKSPSREQSPEAFPTSERVKVSTVSVQAVTTQQGASLAPAQVTSLSLRTHNRAIVAFGSLNSCLQ